MGFYVFKSRVRLDTNLKTGPKNGVRSYWEHKLPEGVKAYSKTKPIKKSEFDNLKNWWKNRKENDQAWKVLIDAIASNGYNLDIKNPHIPEEEQEYSSKELVAMLHDSFRKSDELLENLKEELRND